MHFSERSGRVESLTEQFDFNSRKYKRYFSVSALVLDDIGQMNECEWSLILSSLFAYLPEMSSSSIDSKRMKISFGSNSTL